MEGNLEKLRALMQKHRVDTYIITGADPHQSEYAAAHFHTRQFISGFSGSAGVIMVTQDAAYLWTDGRYHIQAKNELRDGFVMLKTGDHRDREIWDRVKGLPKDSVIAFDGRTVSCELFDKIAARAVTKNIRIRYDLDLTGEIWDGRPPFPKSAVCLHELEFAGENHAKKRAYIRREMRLTDISAYLIVSLDDIAWLFNLRGDDIDFTPVAYAYAFITVWPREEYLFVNREGLNPELKENLAIYGVQLRDYNKIYEFISEYENPGSVLIDPKRVNIVLRERLANKGFKVVEKQDITAGQKAVKNAVQIENIENSQISDGAAVTKFIIWLKNNIKGLRLREGDIHEKLFAYRKCLPHYVSPSFLTIAAFMENAALMHYNPKDGGALIENNGLLLIDSGAQYKNGTTDITRTIVLGKITNEMKRDFTLVLKSHIALARAKWLHGTTGKELDAIARAPIWNEGYDYKSGTGHGLGYFLCVHEGPARFSKKNSDAVLEEGMLLTNEPGIYREGKWGIRTENAVLVVNDRENEYGRFLKLKTVSYCPIDLDGIIFDMLTADEKQWLNAYHNYVYKKLSPFLLSGENVILRQYTKEV